MKLVGVIRPTNTKEIEVDLEVGKFDVAHEELLAKVPEGWQLLYTIRRED